MDKKNITIGIILLLSAFALMFWNSHQTELARQSAPRPVPTASTPAPATTTAPVVSAPGSTQSLLSGDATTPGEAKIISLENDTVRLNLTTRGGGIQTVALLKQADILAHRKNPAEHPYLFNADGTSPALAFSLDGTAPGQLAEWAPAFTVVENIPGQRIVLAAKLPGGLIVTRTYTLPSDEKTDPHVIGFKTAFRADDTATPPLVVRLNTGTLPPAESDVAHHFLGIATYDGDIFHKTDIKEFITSSGFLGIGSHTAKPYVALARGEKPWQWVSVTNQYFAGILRFDEATRARVTDLQIRPLFKEAKQPGQPPYVFTATGDIGFSIPALQPGQEVTLAADYFVGPREYSRLADLGSGQEKAVQFAKLFWVISVDFLCKLFVIVLDFLHDLIPDVPGSWGLAIISLTVIIKAITWPLVTTQQRSAERMRQFQEPMKAIREKYKDDPKRMQQEMMKLYQEHKINPFAGCLPVLIQIPIFTGLFFTFQSLAQLRFQSFLWISDLSMPDVIPGLETIAGFPLHILPIFMGVTLLINMRMTPMPNVEGQQKMIFYGMMIMFPIICYGMPSALMLYYSVQNVLTIFQTFVTRRRFRTELAAAPVILPADTGKSPGKKKKKR